MINKPNPAKLSLIKFPKYKYFLPFSIPNNSIFLFSLFDIIEPMNDVESVI